MSANNAASQSRLLRRGMRLEYVTLGWNVVGIVVLAVAAINARSVALAGFGLGSLVEIVPARWCSGNCRGRAKPANVERFV